MASAKQDAGAPKRQFTREEIEKHDKEGDCWIIVDGKVYDATSVLDWHPGGKAAIVNHAGKVHQETSNEFSSIHDGYAYQKLNAEVFPLNPRILFHILTNCTECILGVVTEKAKTYIKKRRSRCKGESRVISKLDKFHSTNASLGPRQAY
jgi:nitrate reductase (NAD(P)H)